MRAVPADIASGAGMVAGSALLWWSGSRILRNASSRSAAGVEEILGILCSAAGIAALVWWVLAAASAMAAELLTARGHRRAASMAARLSPACMRRLAAAALGANLLAAPGMASAAPPLPTSSTVQEWVAAPGEGTLANPAGEEVLGADAIGEAEVLVDTAPSWRPLPSPPAGGLVLGTDAARSRGIEGARAPEIIVRPGDSLWTIAAAHLGAFATDLEVAAAWPCWYSVNRETIGEDPSLLLPGQVLRIPPTF